MACSLAVEVFALTGQLTVRGQVRPVAFDAQVTAIAGEVRLERLFTALDRLHSEHWQASLALTNSNHS